ncbi:MAG: ATP-binding cassette domain-containing protein, partial [Muribaculaceae bacterium]|nr:ATP-binding cassette domain-containing protein [Muribaculaceae bacterium]
DMNPQDWMAHCGVVRQECKIFTGAILENICLGADDTDETARESGKERVLELLRIVGLDTFVSGLPMGLSTQLGVSGIELSGGQKQRLMIARALYKNPDILFMDEATSSLDANNERSIVDNIRSFGRGKTVIIAAHRLSTVQNADNIIYIRNGEIVEQGTHQQLIERRGDYWRLVHNQLQLSV